MENTLYRSANNRWLAGVCGGIAEYTKIPSILIRLLFVALCLVAIPISVILGILTTAPQSIISPKLRHAKIDAEFEVKE